MHLRFSVALITGTVLAVSTLGHATSSLHSPGNHSMKVIPGHLNAKTSAVSSPITIEGLARVEGILSYCAKVDPKSATKYQQFMSNILTGHSSGEIDTDQGSSRYTFALGVVDQTIAKLPASTVVSACQNMLAGK
jgi:hypothetical protein